MAGGVKIDGKARRKDDERKERVSGELRKALSIQQAFHRLLRRSVLPQAKTPKKSFAGQANDHP